MNNKIDKLLSEIIKMYDLYENYIWEHSNEGYKINILIDHKLIRINWLDKDCDIIYFNQLKFDNQEEKLYEYIALYLIRYVFDGIQIHNHLNSYSNQIHRPYLRVDIYNSNIMPQINDLVSKHNNYQYKEIDNEMYKRYHELNKEQKIDDKVISLAEYRLTLAKRTIKSELWKK